MTQLLPGVKRDDLGAAADPTEGIRIAREAARRLKDAYGDRLREVVLFGSWARGEAHEESDVDLLVVLDEVADRVRETARIVNVLFDLEADRLRAIQAFPAAEADVRGDAGTFVGAAVAEGTNVLRSQS
jgi:predicted nucleotidyltransferase